MREQQSFDNRLFVTLRHPRQGRCLPSWPAATPAPGTGRSPGRPDDTAEASRPEHGDAGARPATATPRCRRPRSRHRPFPRGGTLCFRAMSARLV
jgi:hypothetical protein